ncbi:MAG: hypothetical protein R3F49_05220 [Planctomycetota bacterium]
MADTEKKEAPDKGAEPAKGNKGPMKLLVGIVLLIAGGGGVAMMAMPKKDKGPETFGGPWSFSFFDKEWVGNTKDDNFSRYIKLSPSCNYFAYDELYSDSRKADPDFTPALDEAMTNVVARFELQDIMKDGSGEEMALAAELEHVFEPIMFPVHIGDTKLPLATDEKSGLRPGDSQERKGTFRGAFREYKLKIDAKAKTAQLGGGEVVTFTGQESDLEVRGSDGRTVYLDVTKLKPSFKGEVNVGVHGRIRQIHLGRKLAQ